MAEPKPVGVLEFLGDIPYGEVQGTLRNWGSLGGFTREDDPDPVDVGSGPVPRWVVRLVALEAALWDGLGDPRTAEAIARGSRRRGADGRPLHRDPGDPARAVRSSLEGAARW